APFAAEILEVGVDRIEADGAHVRRGQAAIGAERLPGRAVIRAAIGATEIAAAEDDSGGPGADGDERAARARIGVGPWLGGGAPGETRDRQQDADKRDSNDVDLRRERPRRALRPCSVRARRARHATRFPLPPPPP